jgi:hypothetical protein
MRDVAHVGRMSDRRVESNGRMMIRWTKQKEVGERPRSVSLCPSQIMCDVSLQPESPWSDAAV